MVGSSTTPLARLSASITSKGENLVADRTGVGEIGGKHLTPFTSASFQLPAPEPLQAAAEVDNGSNDDVVECLSLVAEDCRDGETGQAAAERPKSMSVPRRSIISCTFPVTSSPLSVVDLNDGNTGEGIQNSSASQVTTSPPFNTAHPSFMEEDPSTLHQGGAYADVDVAATLAAGDSSGEIPVRESFRIPRHCPDDLLRGDDKYWRPGKPLRIAYITWNMANKAARFGEISSYCIHPNAHLIVVGTQENGPYLFSTGEQTRWAHAVTQHCLGDQYELVGKHAMWAIQLLVFARRRDIVQYVSQVHTSHVKTGLMKGLGGNKGGVAVALTLSMVPKEPESSVYGAKRGTTTRPPSPSPLPVEKDHGDDPNLDALPRIRTTVTYARAENDDADLFSPTEATSGDQSFNNTPEYRHRESNVAAAPGYSRESVAPPCMTLLFVTAHLAAHQGAVQNRNKDYQQIVHRLRVGKRGPHRKFFKDFLRSKRAMESRVHRVPNSAAASGNDNDDDDESENTIVGTASFRLLNADSDGDVLPLSLPSVSSAARAKKKVEKRDVTEEFDLTLFGGDLNYRINGTRKAIEYVIHHYRNIRSILINNDQLSLERAKGSVFNRFQEGTLLFRPTYKYEVSSIGGVTLDQYNFSHKKTRMPAYCDRVLYKKRHGSTARRVTIRLYTDVPNVRTSDHRPVVAIFDVGTRAAATL